MHSRIRALHTYTSLVLGVLWLLQAASGTLLSFHDLVAGAPTRASVAALADAATRAMAQLGPAHIRSIKAIPDSRKLQILIAVGGGHSDAVEVGPKGHILARAPFDYDYPAPGLIQTARALHTHLFAGTPGRYLLGLSGLLLVTNIFLGLKIGWPRPGQWRRWLLPPRPRTPVMRFLTWHRALGLWFALPAMALVTMGVLLAYDAPLARLIGALPPPPAIHHSSAPIAVSPARAMRLAGARFPTAAFTQITLPRARAPYYTVRLHQPGESRKSAGVTFLYINATTGSILRVDDGRRQAAKTAFLDDIYPLHTGEIFGPAGQIVSQLVGLWLMAMIVLGFSLWWTRRKLGKTAPTTGGRAQRVRAPVRAH